MVLPDSSARGCQKIVSDSSSAQRRKGRRLWRLGAFLFLIGLAAIGIAMTIGAPPGNPVPADSSVVDSGVTGGVIGGDGLASGGGDGSGSGSVADGSGGSEGGGSSEPAPGSAMGEIAVILVTITGLLTAVSGLITSMAGLIKVMRAK